MLCGKSLIRWFEGCSCAALCFGSASYGQTLPATPVAQDSAAQDDIPSSSAGDIIVTGFRQSLQRAIEIKRAASNISDVISAEDIGKFPDQNIADSLQRITGVQITRSHGEGSSVSVRGLAPSFTQTRYNGRIITSPSGSRSFEFSTLSSDFVTSVSVNKTPTADMLEGGIAATIDIRTARPLEIGTTKIAATAEGLYEDKSRQAAPHLSLFVNKVFKNNEFGLYFGANWQKRKIRTDTFRAFGLENGQESSRKPPMDYNRDGDFDDTFRFQSESGTQTLIGATNRLTFVGGVEAKPADNIDFHADALYTKYITHEHAPINTLRFTNIACPTAEQGPAPGGCIQDSQVDDGIVTYLDADGVDLRNTDRRTDTRDSTFSASGGVTWTLGPVTIDGEVSHSYSQRLSSGLALAAIARASAYYDMRVDGQTMTQFGFDRGFDPLDGHNFRALGINGTYRNPTYDRNTDGRLDLTWKTGSDLLRSIKAGGYIGDQQESFHSSSVSINAKTLATALGVPYSSTIENGSIDAAPFMTEYTYKNLLSAYGGPATFPTTFLSTDLSKLLAQVPLSTLLEMSPPTENLASEYSVNEKVLAAYVRADFATPDDKLAGNIGLRYVHTRQISDGYAPDLSLITFTQSGAVTRIPGVTPSTIVHRYGEFLPSLNVRYDITPDLLVRLGAARVMSRPDLGILSPSTKVNANTRTITINNPNVKPYLANQLDLSLEYYFEKGGLLSLAVFYKDVSNFIVSTTRVENLNVTETETGNTIQLPFSIFQPDNGSGVKIKGAEIGAQVPFTFLPGLLSGFGIYANYTRLDASKAVVVEGDPAIPLSGVSKNSFNIVGYYEKGPFSGRLAYNYRSGFTSSPTSNFGDGDFVRGYGQLDASMSFDLTRNFTLTLEAQNLTDSYVADYDIYNYGAGFEDVGRRYTAGIRAKF